MHLKKDMHHIFVENAIIDKDEFTEDELKVINKRLLGNTTLKKYFQKINLMVKINLKY